MFEIRKCIEDELHSCLNLVDAPYIGIYFPCMFLEMNFGGLKHRECMSLAIMQRVDIFLLKVDVVPIL